MCNVHAIFPAISRVIGCDETSGFAIHAKTSVAVEIAII
jgi:hypothetical protein